MSHTLIFISCVSVTLRDNTKSLLLLIKKGVCTQQRKSVKVNDNQILNNAVATHILQETLYGKNEGSMVSLKNTGNTCTLQFYILVCAKQHLLYLCVICLRQY